MIPFVCIYFLNENAKLTTSLLFLKFLEKMMMRIES